MKVLATVVAFAFLATACGGGDSDDTSTDTSTPAGGGTEAADEGTPVDGGNLIVAVESETTGWNPGSNQWALEGNLIGSSMIEALTVINSAGDAVPWLAESITPNATSDSFEIKLREGITFHDGTPMTAEVVAASMEFQNSPNALASIVSSVTVGAPVVTGPYTIQVPTLVQYGAFPAALGTPYGYVMPPSMLADVEFGSLSPVGTGPFKFKQWQKDRAIQVTANADYWGGPCAVATDPDEALKTLCEDIGVPLGQKGGPFLETMEFRPIPDPVQRQQALEAGDVDLILNMQPTVTANLRKADYQVVTDYTTEQYFAMLQTKNPPFDSLNARLALAYATDRVGLLQLLGAGEDIPLDTSPFEEDSPWGGLAPDDTAYPMYDPVKAQEHIELYKQEMADAGTPVEALSFTLQGVATLDELEAMQALSEIWGRVGIETQIESVNKGALIVVQVSGEFQAMMARNYSFADPDQEYQFFASTFAEPPIAINFNQWANETTDAALNLGRAGSELTFRKLNYDNFVRERNANVPDVWLYNNPLALIGDTNIRGLNSFRNLGIAGYSSKPWVGGFWLDPDAT